MSLLRQVEPAPNCPDMELAASSWPRRLAAQVVLDRGY